MPFDKQIGGAIDAVIAEVSQAVFAAAESIAVEAQLSITRGSVSGKAHVPSRPGEPPSNDSGVLAGGIEANRTGPLAAEVSANAPYSVPLEFGTSKMAARPFMAPARDKMRPEAQRMVAKAINRAMRRHFRN